LIFLTFETESNTESVKVYVYGQAPISFGERLLLFIYVYKHYTNASNLTHDIYEHLLLKIHFLEKASICLH